MKGPPLLTGKSEGRDEKEEARSLFLFPRCKIEALSDTKCQCHFVTSDPQVPLAPREHAGNGASGQDKTHKEREPKRESVHLVSASHLGHLFLRNTNGMNHDCKNGSFKSTIRQGI